MLLYDLMTCIKYVSTNSSSVKFIDLNQVKSRALVIYIATWVIRKASNSFVKTLCMAVLNLGCIVESLGVL